MSMLLQLAEDVADGSQLPTAEADVSVELFARPNVLVCFDAAKLSSWSGNAPAHGATVTDLTQHARNGTWQNSPAQTLATAGGGWDFAGAADIGSYIDAPAGVANTIWNGGTNKRWLIVAWVKVPSSAEFGTTNGKLCPIVSFADATPVSAGNEEIGALYWYREATGNRIYYARKTAPTGWVFGYLNPDSNHYGKIAQLAIWWDGTSLKARLKTIDGFTLSDTTASAGSNTENFSAQTFKVGPIKSWTTSVPLTGDMKDWRLYRTFVVDLTGAGITDPTAKLDQEYSVVVARSAFS
jgi:hypothetical protein